jgi:hypothetical protein
MALVLGVSGFAVVEPLSYLQAALFFPTKARAASSPHHLLPLARSRFWLWEVIKQRLGFSLSITIPLEV